MQFAWLERFEGTWLLLNHSDRYPARTWMDRDVALSELRGEGWMIKPHRKRQKLRGYAMMRTVH